VCVYKFDIAVVNVRYLIRALMLLVWCREEHAVFSVPSSGSRSCLRFGLWLILHAIKYFIYLLTWQFCCRNYQKVYFWGCSLS